MGLTEEKQIIERLRSGESEALETVYTHHREEFFLWITKYYNCSLEEAKDVYQNAILVFYENVVSGRLSEMTSSIKTYIFAIGKYKIMEQKKKAYRFVPDKQLADLSQQEHSLEEWRRNEQELQMVERCLQLLGDPCKSILELYYYQRLSMAEITTRLHYKNVDTTKNLKYKCIQRLKKLYTEQWPDKQH